MRELVFNDLSVQQPAPSLRVVQDMLADLAKGLASLIDLGIASAALRMTQYWQDYKCAPEGTLWSALVEMQAARRHVEETRFLMRLTQKAPLLVDLPTEVVDRFLGCESHVGTLGGDALVICAHLSSIAVSLPIQDVFDRDRLLVRFNELRPDLEVDEVEETVDNVARLHHAITISERDRSQLLGTLDAATLWQQRTRAFPALTFGAAVEEHLYQIPAEAFAGVVNRLAELNDAAQEWRVLQLPAPLWRSKVTPESETVMNNQHLAEKRIFPTVTGALAMFEWHARFGSGFRIHLRFDRQSFAVEIGYIGKHLPLR